jgi:hypothetical protein
MFGPSMGPACARTGHTMSRDVDPGDLGGRLYTAVAGNRASMNTEPSGFSDALKFFLRAAGGSVSAAARLMGVPRRTARDWYAGKGLGPRSAERRRHVAESATVSSRRQRLAAGREGRLRGGDQYDIVVKGVYNYDGGEERDVRIGPYLDDGTLDAVVDAYLDGADAAELRQLFADHITDPFYQRTMGNPPTDDDGWTVNQVVL